MQIQVNTDKHVEGSAALTAHVDAVLRAALRHVRDHVTRVEVHLSDASGARSGGTDMRCLMEARLERHPPLVVTQHAASVHQALEGAADKLRAALQATIEQIADARRRRSDDGGVGGGTS